MGAQLNSRQDSVAYADKLAGIYAQDPDNDAVLTTLTSIYSSLGMQNKAEENCKCCPCKEILIAMERW